MVRYLEVISEMLVSMVCTEVTVITEYFKEVCRFTEVIVDVIGDAVVLV